MPSKKDSLLKPSQVFLSVIFFVFSEPGNLKKGIFPQFLCVKNFVCHMT
jgi:hypothetical protein